MEGGQVGPLGLITCRFGCGRTLTLTLVGSGMTVLPNRWNQQIGFHFVGQLEFRRIATGTRAAANQLSYTTAEQILEMHCLAAVPASESLVLHMRSEG